MSLLIACYMCSPQYTFANSEFICLYYCASLLLVTDMIEACRMYSNSPTAVIYAVYKSLDVKFCLFLYVLKK